MISHHRVVNDTKASALAREAKRAFELGDEAARAQRGNVSADAQCHVARVARGDRLGSTPMSVALEGAALASRAVAAAAPVSRRAKREGELGASGRHGYTVT
jgi:hypothetical protein